MGEDAVSSLQCQGSVGSATTGFSTLVNGAAR